MSSLSNADAQAFAEGAFESREDARAGACDGITRLVAARCDVPLALLTYGDSAREVSTAGSCAELCDATQVTALRSRAIAGAGEILIVPDTRNDPRFASDPLVAREPHIRFYASVPVVSAAGFELGTLSVLDTRPRDLTTPQLDVLLAAATAAATLLAYRRAERALRRAAGDVAIARPIVSGVDDRREIPRAVIDGLPGAFFILDASGRILLWNQRLQETLGYASDVIPQLMALDFFDPPDIPRVSEHISRAFVQGHAQLDAAIRTKDGQRIPYFLTASAVTFGGRRCLAGMGIDISDRKRAEDLLRHSASHDALTGLANRVMLDQRLARATELALRDGRCVAVIFLDLDRFKNINDTLGHRVGDELLRAVSGRLQNAIRGTDTVARLGGDEFVVVTELAAEADAETVVTQLIEVFREPFSVAGSELHVTASVGVSVAPRDGIDAESLLRNADTAMYIAKDRGRNKYFFYARDMHVAAARRLSTENDLRRALERNEFELFYQPSVDLQSGETVAAEALIRWRHPVRGLLPPGEFIDVAEETGLIVPIGAWVLAEGARQAKRLQMRVGPPCKISVNVSGRQLRDPAFLGHVRAAVRGLGLPAGSLGIEITESAALGDPDAAQSVLDECKSLGFVILLDDFGTHYSSLTYLKKFPIDVIKIDKSFVDGVPHDTDDAGIIDAIISLAKSLKCEIVAEGVETQAQADWLARHHCSFAMGYHFARPMPAADFERWLGAPSRLNSGLAARRPASEPA